MGSKKYGKNVSKLILQFASIYAIPSGKNALDSMLSFCIDADKRRNIFDKAELEALKAIELLKSAYDNPFGNDDEAIAEMLLQKIKERKAQQRGYPDIK